MKTAVFAVFLAFILQVPAGSIEGTVSLSGTDRPVGNVEIRLGNNFKAITDERGMFVIANIPMGQYPVSIKRDGYVPAGMDISSAMISIRPSSGSFDSVGMISIGAGEYIRNFHVELKSATGVISGVVRNPDGAPLSNVAITLRQVSYDMGRKVITSVPPPYDMDVRSDDRGNFRLFGLLPGDYLVSGNLPSPPKSEAAKRADWRDTYYPGVLYADDAIPVTVRDGEETPHTDITIHTGRPVTISGTVVPSSSAASIAGLIVTPLPDNVDVAVPAPIVIRSLKAGGGFSIGGSALTPGSYNFSFQAVTPEGDYYGVVPVVMAGQSIDGIRVVLQAGVDLKGTTTVQGDLSGINFTSPPVSLKSTRSSFCEPCARQMILNAGKAAIRDSPLNSPVSIMDATGSFTISHIPAGEYFMSPNNLPMGAFLADVRQGDRSILGTAISISDHPEPIHVYIERASATIEGTLLNEYGQGLGYTRVFLLPAAEHRTTFSPYQYAITDYRGRFSFGSFPVASGTLPSRSLPPGTYKLYAWSNIPEGAWTNFSYMNPYEALGTAVTVKSDENLKDVTVNLISK